MGSVQATSSALHCWVVSCLRRFVDSLTRTRNWRTDHISVQSEKELHLKKEVAAPLRVMRARIEDECVLVQGRACGCCHLVVSGCLIDCYSQSFLLRLKIL